MDFAAYALGHRLFILAVWGLVAWVVPMAVAFPPYGRAHIDMDEYAAAYGASRWYGVEFEGVSTLLIRIVLISCGVLMAVPELLGLL